MPMTALSSGNRPGTVSTAQVGAVLAIWTGVVTVAFWKHGVQFVPAPALVPPITAALLIALWTEPGLRAWRRSIPLRSLVLLHVTRFVGFYFLFLSSRGVLPRAFAVPAAAGDIVIAAGAALIGAFWVPPNAGVRRGVLYLWNAGGLADNQCVVGSAAWLTRTAPETMVAFARLPLLLLPAVLVPQIIASHVVLFARLRRGDD
jgi:hypothetical protein